MVWVLVWVLLVVVAVAYLATRLWGVWGQFKELTAEVAHASDTLTGLQAQAERLGDRTPPAPLAVFEDPRQLRRERHATRGALKQERRARRAAHQPRWARPVD